MEAETDSSTAPLRQMMRSLSLRQGLGPLMYNLVEAYH